MPKVVIANKNIAELYILIYHINIYTLIKWLKKVVRKDSYHYIIII
jgi:hypothetical protein